MPSLVIESDTVSLWISKIEKTHNEDNELMIDISIQSNVALKGLKFQLSHTPLTKVETIPQLKELSMTQIGEEKLFEDITLHPRFTYDLMMLDTTLQIDYANDVSTFLNFDNLDIKFSACTNF